MQIQQPVYPYVPAQQNFTVVHAHQQPIHQYAPPTQQNFAPVYAPPLQNAP